jgi:hypothetical protein
MADRTRNGVIIFTGCRAAIVQTAIVIVQDKGRTPAP